MPSPFCRQLRGRGAPRHREVRSGSFRYRRAQGRTSSGHLHAVRPARFRVDAKSQAAARLFRHRVVLRTTEFAVRSGIEEERPPIQRLYAALAANDARNALIFDDVLKSLEERRSPLILTERKDHALHLAERLSRFARNVVVLTGGMGAKQRRAITQRLDDIPTIDERVLVATAATSARGSMTPGSTPCSLRCQSHGKGRSHNMSGACTDCIRASVKSSSTTTLMKPCRCSDGWAKSE